MSRSKENKMQTKFNNLEIIEDLGIHPVGDKGYKKRFVMARCDCGNVKRFQKSSLVTGRTKSCGCLQLKSVTKHGYTGKNYKHPIYRALEDMKRRCYSDKNKYFKDYGGRGITVCEEWRDNFIAFKDWSEQNGWEKGLTIDRIDNNKGYSPDNCRWITMTEQNQNQRSTKLNPKMVLEMRELYDRGMTITEIANKYEQKFYNVSKAVKRQTWKNI